jgi:hypothetical protein
MAKLFTGIQLEAVETDLASSMIAAGRIAEGRQKTFAVAQSAKHQIIRWTALHNLMYAAILENDQHTFELYRRTLEFAPLHPGMAVVYRHYAAKGLWQFGQTEQAVQEAARSAALAKRYGISNWNISQD